MVTHGPPPSTDLWSRSVPYSSLGTRSVDQGVFCMHGACLYGRLQLASGNRAALGGCSLRGQTTGSRRASTRCRLRYVRVCDEGGHTWRGISLSNVLAVRGQTGSQRICLTYQVQAVTAALIGPERVLGAPEGQLQQLGRVCATIMVAPATCVCTVLL